MLRFLLRRLAEAIPTLFLISVLTFALVRLAPGDPLADEKAQSPEVRAALRRAFGMVHEGIPWTGIEVAPDASAKAPRVASVAHDSPASAAGVVPGMFLVSAAGTAPRTQEDFDALVSACKPAAGLPLVLRDASGRESSQTIVIGEKPRSIASQYWTWLGNTLRGDLGPSMKYQGWSVSELIAAKFPVSLQLGLGALLVAIGAGVATGLVAAWRPNSAVDHGAMGLALAGICLPSFVIGPLLALVFAVKLGWLPASGWHTPGDFVLPTLALGLGTAAVLARLTRGSMLEVFNQDYMRTARAKGVPEWRVTCVHGLRNGLLPVVASLAPLMAALISGSFVAETIFNIPGLGKFFVSSAMNRDFTLVMGCVLFFSTLLVVLNILGDLLMAWLNPRIRLE